MDPATARGAARDARGAAIFDHGDVGAAHVRAHRRLDGGDHARGHRELGAWLAGTARDPARHSAGDWVHLQWHMLVFELAVGRWGEAHRRFLKEILPIAVSTSAALTDAPAALWRLHLSASQPVALPWAPIAEVAARRPQACAYVELHNVLALAGTGDVGALDRWIARAGSPDPLVARWAHGLRSLARGDHETAAAELSEVVAGVDDLGGSRAQNQLFAAIRDHAIHLAADRRTVMRHRAGVGTRVGLRSKVARSRDFDGVSASRHAGFSSRVL